VAFVGASVIGVRTGCGKESNEAVGVLIVGRTWSQVVKTKGVQATRDVVGTLGARYVGRNVTECRSSGSTTRWCVCAGVVMENERQVVRRAAFM
jgi:hypothetical protein